ncbi:MAG: dihydrofolate reductase [Hyphomonadaceae bacterium]
MSSAKPKLLLVVARARNGVIGAQGGLPWRLGSDLKRFKAATLGKPVIMGRKTWDSLPKAPLPGRDNIVVSRDIGFRPQGARVFSDFEAALAAGQAMAAGAGAGEYCVIGGAGLFERALPRADALLLTEVDLAPEGDVFFPPFDESQWRETAREVVTRGPNDDADFVVRRLERIA